MKQIAWAVAIFTLLIPFSTTYAETVLRASDDVSIEHDQIIDGDFYGSAGPFGRLTMSGEIAHDALMFAGSVLANGTVGEDLQILAGSAQVGAATDDDVRIVAADAVLSSTVGGDVIVLAGTFEMLSTAEVKGNVYVFGGTATIDGVVDGSVYGTLEHLTLNGTVAGDVDVNVPAGLVVGNEAHITGALTYESNLSLQRAPSAIIEGAVNGKQTAGETTREKVRSVLTPVFVLLFAALTLYLFFKRGLLALVKTIDASPLSAVGIGAATAFGAPIAAVLLMLTFLGFLLGGVLFGAIIVLYALAIPLAGVVCGAFMYRAIFGNLEVSPVTVVGGTVLLLLVAQVPVVGPLVMIGVLFITMGGLTRGLYQILHTRAE